MMLWVAAPPSDHLRNTNVRFCGPKICGLGALIELFEPTITVRVNGAVPAVPPTTSSAPVGLELNVSTTVCGSSRTVVLTACPSESVAVSTRSKKDGYSWSGAVNEPEATPGNDWITCVWQFVGLEQCCRSSRQLSDE